ncbi:helix-turn-helix transcriptional regulator [Nocardioides gilvus]|uniref:helix-turn-helix transcriptional regulator n=1 Tax=Nocardioides gilvus TaxID=1735589 RepID=UPI0013A56CE3|nr:DNA-binding response regulator [Nocardioides gilvus]
MKTPRVLESLGLPSSSQRFYRQLRVADGLSVEEVAERLEMSPEELVDQMAPLVAVGVASLTDGTLRVVPPQHAVGILLEREASALALGVERVASLVASVRLLGSGSAATDGLDPGLPNQLDGEVVDSAAPMEMIEAWVAESSGDIMFLRPDQWRLPSEPRSAALFDQVLQQGRRARAIYPVRALHEARSMLIARSEAGEEIRLLPEVPTRLGIVGQNRALMPEYPGATGMRTTVLRDPGLVAILSFYFEVLWDQSVALHSLMEGDSREELQDLLLTELASGARDEQIARRLGIGLRTVRRRVANLMLELGAETRFEAGVEAVRRGLI